MEEDRSAYPIIPAVPGFMTATPVRIVIESTSIRGRGAATTESSTLARS
jgi:hypothetical protein